MNLEVDTPRFYNVDLTDDLVSRRDRVYNYIINNIAERILNNTIYNRNRFNAWLENPVLNFAAVFEEGIEIDGNADIGGDFYANGVKANKVNNNGDLRVGGEIYLEGEELLKRAYPVGSVYINGQSNQNPENVLGFGKWEEFSEGRILVGEGGNLSGEGGEQLTQLSVSQMPAHSHSSYTDQANDNHRHKYKEIQSGPTTSSGGWGSRAFMTNARQNKETDPAGGDHNHTIDVEEVGDGNPHNNLQPYVVVRMWKRVE